MPPPAPDARLSATAPAHETADDAAGEAASRQSQRRDAHLALALDAAAMGAWTWDLATDTVTWSASIAPIHGRAPGSFGGTRADFLGLVHPDEREGVRAVIAAALADRDAYHVAYRTLLPDGGVRFIEGRGRVLRDAEGQATGIAGIVHDVTESRAATAALSASEERYRALTEVAPQIVWSADAGGAVTFVNRSWQIYTGLTLAASRGAGWLAAVQPDHRARAAAEWQAAVETRTDCTMELPLRDATGAYRWHVGRAQRLHDAAGAPTGWVGTALDIHDHRILEAERERLLTAERAARQTAEDAVQMRDTFLSVAAHELNTPLTALRGNIQLIQRRYARGQLDADRFDRAFAALDAATLRLARLVHELLDVSRLQTGNLTLAPDPLDLVAIVRASLAGEFVLLDAHHTLVIALPDAPIPVRADAARLTQVLTNLLSNAVKYSPNGGEITVSVAPAPAPENVDDAEGAAIGAAITTGAGGAGATVRVRDRGIGLPAGSAEAIFTPFARAANAVRGHVSGLGLGLYISRGIVTAHGGRMWAESPGEGQGTVVAFWLPVAASS